MGLITKFRARVKSSKISAKSSSARLTYQQEQLFGLHISQSGLIMSELGKTPSPHGIYYNLMGCPRGKKSYYNYDCNFQKNPETRTHNYDFFAILQNFAILPNVHFAYVCKNVQ